LQGFADYIEEKRIAWKTPGVAVAVIKDDEVIFSQTFGQRNVEENLPVTPNTIFAIGSSTKAFTATSVAIAVEDGNLDWDKPVRDYLPRFKMKDDFATARISVRDMLCHRSGLPRHDLAWYNSVANREQLIERIAYLEPTRDFRTYFQYQNFMYMAAGYLAGYVEGTTWEDLVRQRIFNPLGMRHSQFSVDESQQTDDYALPYSEKHDEIVRSDFRNITTVGPAGSINSNLVDMIEWVKLQLNRGKVGEKTIFSEESAHQLHSPQMVIADPLWEQIFGVKQVSYGLGWFIDPYHDQTLIHHGGNIDGFSALVSFMPGINAGAVILTNLNGNFLPHVIMHELYDRLLSARSHDWHTQFKDLVDKLKAQIKEADAKADKERVTDTQPSHPLDDYCGEFENPGYGVFSITHNDEGTLEATYNDFPARLEHYHYDVFDMFNELRESRLKVVFHTDVKGQIDRLEVPYEPTGKPIEFIRKGNK
jgi:CubicO group peptidase (beta-lactamase class C family)